MESYDEEEEGAGGVRLKGIGIDGKKAGFGSLRVVRRDIGNCRE